MLKKAQIQDFNSERSQQVMDELLGVYRKRRTIRQFSDQPVELDLILKAVEIAGTAPSGANKQPWSFVVISDPAMKLELRKQAELEEVEFYRKRAPQKWLNDLEPLHTNEKKAFITQAPHLIAVFFKNYELNDRGQKSMNYYAKESVGLATGLLLSSLHLAGLSALTYTPSDQKFLLQLLDRPCHEKPFMVLAVGVPAGDAQVPVMTKKSLSDIATTYRTVDEREEYFARKIESAGVRH